MVGFGPLLIYLFHYFYRHWTVYFVYIEIEEEISRVFGINIIIYIYIFIACRFIISISIIVIVSIFVETKFILFGLIVLLIRLILLVSFMTLMIQCKTISIMFLFDLQ